MDSPGSRTRKDIQGPGQPPPRVPGDSSAIQKPRRPPIIIYTESPKIIHAKPEEFKSVVQRLTGLPKSSTQMCSLVDRSDRCDESGSRSSSGFERIECAIPMGDPVADSIFSGLQANATSVDMFHNFCPEFQGGNRDFSHGSLGSTSISPCFTFPDQPGMDISDDFFDP